MKSELFALKWAVAFLLARQSKTENTPLTTLHTALCQEVATITSDPQSTGDQADQKELALAAEAAMTTALDELFSLSALLAAQMEN